MNFTQALGEIFTRGEMHIENVIENVLGSLPVALYITDQAGMVVYYNHAATALWGQSPGLGQSRWCGSWRLFWPDGRPMSHGECPMALALKGIHIERGSEIIAERPDGSRVRFMSYPTLVRDASDRLLCAINTLLESTDRHRANSYAQQLAAIVEFSDDAIISKDLNGIITSWNRSAERLFGYTTHEAIGQPITMLIPDELAHEEAHIIGSIRRGQHVDHLETKRRHKNGSLIDISLTSSPVKDADGKIIGASKIARDIGGNKKARQQELLLINELKHRMKNTIATVQAMASQTLCSAAKSDREAFFARLHALAGAYDLLTHENWNQVPLDGVARQTLAAFKEMMSDRISIDGPHPLMLNAQNSSLLAMTLHELATNALKYGALSKASGKVALSWELCGEGESRQIILRWIESGGPPVQAPRRKGFGTHLIKRSIGNAKLEFKREGLHCTLQIPY